MVTTGQVSVLPGAKTLIGERDPATGETGYHAVQVIALTGVKYRFLDYACRAGLLDSDRAPGSGYVRLFTAREIEIVHAAHALTQAGFIASAAFCVARDLTATSGEHRVIVGSIYELSITIRVRPDLTGSADEATGRP